MTLLSSGRSLSAGDDRSIVRQPRIFRFQGRGLRQATLRSKGIDYFEKRELIEIGVPGANWRDAMFAHKNGGVRVVEQIAGEVRQLQNDLFGDVGVPFGSWAS
jgi:hypothetical protein